MAFDIRQKTFMGATFRFACEPEMHSSWWSFDDEDSVRERWWKIRAGDVVLDCGAAFGSYAFPALALNAAKVVAWTPEGHLPFFEASIEANPGWKERVIIFDTGLWSATGWLEAMEHSDLPVFHERFPDVWRIAQPRNAFPVTTVDRTFESLPELGRVDWMKLDVEGAELEVLKGASRVIRTYRPKVLCENHLFKDPELQLACGAFIASLGVGYREVETVPYHAVSHTLYSV